MTWAFHAAWPWSRTGLLRFAPRPDRAAERWSISGAGFTTQALALRGHGPAVILLPHLDGTSRIAEYVARRFGVRGYQVLALLPPGVALPSDAAPESVIGLLERRVRAGRAAVQLATRELGAPCRVLVGVSLGSITAIPVAALEPGVDAVVAMLAGADLAWLASHSEDPRVRALTAGVSSEPATDATRDAIAALDPLSYAANLVPERILLVRARWDATIPARASQVLREALGAAREVVYPAGHYSFGYFLPFALDDAIEHADARCGVRAR